MISAEREEEKEKATHLDRSSKPFLQRSKGNGVAVKTSVHKLHLKQCRLDVAGLYRTEEG
jgi:hypothetical protein